MIIEYDGRILNIAHERYNCFFNLYSVHDITNENQVLFLGRYIAKDIETVLEEIGEKKK